MTIVKTSEIIEWVKNAVEKKMINKPDVPVLPVNYALASFFLRFIIVLVNFITCAFIIANIIHHW